MAECPGEGIHLVWDPDDGSGSGAGMYRPCRCADDLMPRNARTGEVLDIPLVEDLARVLAHTVVGWNAVIGHDLAEAPEVKRVLARYRRYKEASP